MTFPSDSPLHDDAIEATAAAWLVEREEGLSPEQAEAFRQWCEASPKHASTVARLEQTQRLLTHIPRLRDDAALSRQLDAMLRPQAAPVFRFPLFQILAVAATIALAGLWWTSRPNRNFEQNFATTAGGDARVTLPDDSFVEMNGNSQVAVKFTPGERDVSLVAGEAHFKVAKDPARPFIVSAGQIRVRAVGTMFNVRLAATGVDVLVSEGKVQVARVESNSAGVETRELLSELVAGQRLQVPTAGNFVKESAVAATRIPSQPVIAARLVFSGTPLARVVEEFNRHNRIQLVLDDADIADRPVGGSFQADNVEAFVRLLESSGEILAERTYESTIILRKAK